ncbi:2Fe-2S iron-sulfur cluster-binding protein [Neptuniibacter sp. SY11_33]|uniref:2Fe-2S iron-sulfur cluster-binding protein n=1 Tax=Neptuniibacter sp. SY11_33 TaxID=3398215 RepID=UPI0039F59523
MVSVRFEEADITVKEGSNLLEALLDAGHDIPNSCRAGACQCCMLQATEGTPPTEAQKGLKETQKQQGYFLACRCQPNSEMSVQLNEQVSSTEGILISKQQLTDSVLQLKLKADIEYLAGQYINLVRHDGLSRSYSIASVKSIDDHIELQLRIFADGQFSQWALNDFVLGENIELQGPFGDCFYTKTDSNQPIIMAGTGTGLAPLYGIVRDALKQGHTGPISLFAGAKNSAGLYLVEEIKALSEHYENLTYYPVVLEETGSEPDGCEIGDINAVVKNMIPNTKGYRAYFCGSEDRVKTLRKQTFLAGANMQDIYCDLFTPSS